MDRVRITTVGTPPRDVAFDDELSIGRFPENGLRLPSRDVSGRHLVLHRRGDRCFVEDLGSRHGTLVNGTPLREGAPRPLAPGDRIVVSGYLIQYLADGDDTLLLEALERADEEEDILPPPRARPLIGPRERLLAKIALILVAGALLATVLAAL